MCTALTYLCLSCFSYPHQIVMCQIIIPFYKNYTAKDTAPRKERCPIFSSYYASVHYLLLRLFLPFSNDNIVLEVIAPPIATDMVMIQISNAMLSPVEGFLRFPSTAKSAPRLAPSTTARVLPIRCLLQQNQGENSLFRSQLTITIIIPLKFLLPAL